MDVQDKVENRAQTMTPDEVMAALEKAQARLSTLDVPPAEALEIAAALLAVQYAYEALGIEALKRGQRSAALDPLLVALAQAHVEGSVDACITSASAALDSAGMRQAALRVASIGDALGMEDTEARENTAPVSAKLVIARALIEGIRIGLKAR